MDWEQEQEDELERKLRQSLYDGEPEQTLAIPDYANADVTAEGLPTEDPGVPVGNNVIDAVGIRPELSMTAQEAKLAAKQMPSRPASYAGQRFLGAEKSILDRLQTEDDVARNRFNQLSLAGGKDDDVEGHVAQAILAFAPIVAGYMLGGNELGAYGAKLGVNASTTYEKDKEKRSDSRKRAALAEKAQLVDDSRTRQKQMESIMLQRARADDAPNAAVARELAFDEAGLRNKGMTVSITNDMSKAASVEAAKEFTKQKFAANSMLTSTGLTLNAIQNYLAKRPEAKGESFAGAAIRNIKDAVTKPEEAALLESALSLDTLNTANALIKGVVSDADQVKIDAAAQREWNVPIETMEEVVKAMGRRLIKLQEQNRMMMEEMQTSDGWRAPAPAEAEMARRLGVAPAQMSERERLQQLRQKYSRTGGL
jgi:hypothetical protein